jgi:hypothetical protein
MRLSKSWRFARGVSRVAAALLCLGVLLSLLSLPTTESAVSTALAMANVAHTDQGANGNAPPLDGTYPFALAEEPEDPVKRPVNAELLTLLLLAVSSFFGLSIGWLLTNTQRQGVNCSFFGVVGGSLASACEDRPFLGVFRL